MSLASWKREFYPVPASKVPVAEALDHSIRKWEGLRPEALARHGLDVGPYGQVVSPRGVELAIDADTCALCIHHIDDCKRCPLAIARGANCCSVLEDERNSPYVAWCCRKDPEPMLVQLRRAKEAS